MVWLSDTMKMDDSYGNSSVDSILCDYLHILFSMEHGKAEASAAYYGLVHRFPELKDSLSQSKRALMGYHRATPSIRYPPMPWTVCVSLSDRLIRMGLPIHAIGLLVSFDCYLRINELRHIRVSDVALPGDTRFGQTWSYTFIHLRRTKTGTLQGVRVHNSEVATLLKYLVRITEGDGYLFDFSAASFRTATVTRT
jgi:hypothetical protein